MSSLVETLQLRRDQLKQLPLSLSKEDCAGKTYIVTGANSGLGYEATKHLAAFKADRVILAVRNLTAGETALREIESATKTPGILHVWHLDLAKYSSVASFMKRVERELDRVDGLILNAAVGMGQWIVCEEGREMNMTVNLVSQVLLTVGLMPHLKKAGEKTGYTPRITIIGSGAAFSGMGQKCWQKLDKRNIMEDVKNKERWNGEITEFYPFSKLLLLFVLRHMAEIYPVSQTGVIFNYVNPGLCVTNLDRNAKFSLKAQIAIGRMLMGRTAEMGSRTLLHGAAAGVESHGQYLTECEVKEHMVPAWAKDEESFKAGETVWKELQGTLEKVKPGCVSALS